MSDPEGTQDYRNDIVGIVDINQSVGQSFISRRPHLYGITIWLTTLSDFSNDQNHSFLTIKLFHTTDDPIPIYEISLPIPPEWENSPVDIPIPRQDNTPQQPYYIQLESNDHTIQVHGRMEDAYIGGNAFLNKTAQSSDIAFRLYYDYDTDAVIGDIRDIGEKSWLLGILCLTLFLPGWFLLDITGVRNRITISEQVTLSVGLTLTVIPILMLWSTILHISWNHTIILFSLTILFLYFIVRNLLILIRSRREIIIRRSENLHAPRSFHLKSEWTTWLLLATIVISAYFIRHAMVRDLATPAWVDSVHHATITQQIMQQGYLPSSYEPYMDFNIYNYHPGFHAGLAVFTWLSGVELPDAMLIYGQFINALIALSVFLLTFTYTRSTVAGLFAAFITSFLTPMPAYYTSWGRYTQLTGLFILSTALLLARPNIFSSHHQSRREKSYLFSYLLGAIALAGLFLVHYRVIGFLVTLLLADFLSGLIKNPKTAYYTKHWVLRFLIITILASVLVLPWLIPSVTQIFIPKFVPAQSGDTHFFGDFSWRFLTTAYGKQAMVLAGLGLILSLIKNPRLSSIIVLWILQLAFLANLDYFGLPGGGFITGTSVVIMLFIPISLMGGYLLSDLASSWRLLLKNIHQPIGAIMYQVGMIFVLVYTALIGARQLLPIINPITILTRQADRYALEWIGLNIPQDSRFLINPFSWGFGLYAGNDGGYWLSPVTGAISVPPPALYGLGNQETIESINEICSSTASTNTTPQQLEKLMLENRIKYIFIGSRGGTLSPSALLASRLFKQIYNVKGVQILELISHP